MKHHRVQKIRKTRRLAAAVAAFKDELIVFPFSLRCAILLCPQALELDGEVTRSRTLSHRNIFCTYSKCDWISNFGSCVFDLTTSLLSGGSWGLERVGLSLSLWGSGGLPLSLGASLASPSFVSCVWRSSWFFQKHGIRRKLTQKFIDRRIRLSFPRRTVDRQEVTTMSDTFSKCGTSYFCHKTSHSKWMPKIILRCPQIFFGVLLIQ